MQRAFAAVIQHIAESSWTSLRFTDLLIAPFLLAPEPLLAYFAARLMSLCVPLSLWFPSRKIEPYLLSLGAPEPGRAFQAAAARVNLGFMMIAAAVSLAVFWGTPLIASVIEEDATRIDEILLWLLAGQLGTLLFGATRLIMHAAGRGAFTAMLEGIAAACFAAAIVFGNGSDPVYLAQALVAAQLTQSALSALLLTQCGVWPGLTSLLNPQIRLR